MASSSKKRTTMAKIARENKLRERRIDKQAKKDRRKLAAADGEPVSWLGEAAGMESDEAAGLESDDARGVESDGAPPEAQPADEGVADA
ncbi:MAG: hypothetical protein QOK19_664 [Solirubrobacteraceae bacterium]|jgi:hypothetical protein|nr:hypothetical protein [Solirubrobacterales bacterium]MEA2215103.1 hypothetical protein [Solirubrobacteraceae bacterium]